jgi:gliding motility-associated-like protein
MTNKLRLLFVFYFLFLIIPARMFGQTQIDTAVRHVISSGGGTSGTSLPWGSVDYTIGEVIITSDSVPSSSPFSSVKWLTQGFQQPSNGLLVQVVGVNSTCTGGNNGSVNLVVKNSSGVVKFSFKDTALTANHLFEGLGPGIYPYSVKDARFRVSGTVTVLEDQIDCENQLTIYHGFTPNGNHQNDKWEIDGITNYSSNTVSLYNRWGDLVWSKKDYNNTTIVWEGDNDKGQPLPEGTYFYIIEFNKRMQRGWVELTR